MLATAIDRLRPRRGEAEAGGNLIFAVAPSENENVFRDLGVLSMGHPHPLSSLLYFRLERIPDSRVVALALGWEPKGESYSDR